MNNVPTRQLTLMPVQVSGISLTGTLSPGPLYNSEDLLLVDAPPLPLLDAVRELAALQVETVADPAEIAAGRTGLSSAESEEQLAASLRKRGARIILLVDRTSGTLCGECIFHLYEPAPIDEKLLARFRGLSQADGRPLFPNESVSMAVASVVLVVPAGREKVAQHRQRIREIGAAGDFDIIREFMRLGVRACILERAQSAGIAEASSISPSLREIIGTLRSRPGKHLVVAECSTRNLPRYLMNGWEEVGAFEEPVPTNAGETFFLRKHLIVLDLLDTKQEALVLEPMGITVIDAYGHPGAL